MGFEFDTNSPNYSPLNKAGATGALVRMRNWGSSKCGDRITTAQTRYEEADCRWQAQNKADNLKGAG